MILPGQRVVPTTACSSVGLFRASLSLTQPLMFRKLVETHHFLCVCPYVKFGYCSKSKICQDQVNRHPMYLNAHKKLCFLRKQGKFHTSSSGSIGTCIHHLVPAERQGCICSLLKALMLGDKPIIARQGQPCLGDSGVHASFVTFENTFLSLGCFLEFCLGFRVVKLLLPWCACCLVPVSCYFRLLLTFCFPPAPFSVKPMEEISYLGKN